MLTLRTFGWSDLPTDLLAVLAEYTTERSFRANEVVFKAGQTPDEIYFVVSGEVEVRGESFSRRLGPKTAVGGLSAYAEEAMTFDVVAVAPTMTLALAVDDSYDIFEDHFPILKAVLMALSRETSELRTRLGPAAGFSNEILDDPPDGGKLDLVQRMAALYQALRFARAHLESIADLAREAREVRYAAGYVLWREGDAADYMLVIIRGKIDCTTEAGQQFSLGPEDAAGTAANLAKTPRWYKATVSRDLVALHVRHESFYDILEDRFELAMEVVTGLSRFVLSLVEQAHPLASASSLEAGEEEASAGEARPAG